MNNFKFRRRFLLITAAIFLMSTVIPSFANVQDLESASVQKKLMDIESASGGRIGISAINTANNQRIQYRSEERFPFCSTFKMMVVAAVLKQSMTDAHLLQQRIMYKKEDMDTVWSPITTKNITNGMTISELSAAAIMYSDNTAVNLLMKKLGGLETINAFARSIGNTTFRLDRWEPELNTAIPGDNRDTTTPQATAADLQRLVLGDALAPPQREQLTAWLKNNTTGDFRIRAGVPKDWVVGDKTGGGKYYAVTNDIGIVWPPKCPPVIIAIYFTQNKKDAPHREDTVASVTRALMSEFGKTGQCIR